MRNFSIRIPLYSISMPLCVAFLLVLMPVSMVTSSVSAETNVSADKAEPLPEVAPLAMAPDFKLEDPDGKIYQLSGFKGRIVVLEWINPECPFVKRHYKEGTMVSLSKKYGDKVTWLAINSTSRHGKSDNSAWMASNNLPYPILDDSAGVVGRAFKAKTTPHMFIVDAQGSIAYEGAIDSDSDGSSVEGRTSYVDQALGELTSGKEVSVRDTRSYGCSVKYSG